MVAPPDRADAAPNSDRRTEEAVAMRAAAGSFRDDFLVARHNRGEIVAVEKSRPPACRNERGRRRKIG